MERLAGGLEARGNGAGRVVAIMAPNVPESCGRFHGVVLAGGTMTTINPGYTAEEARDQLRDAGAGCSSRCRRCSPTRARGGARAPAVREIVVIGGGGGGDAARGADRRAAAGAGAGRPGARWARPALFLGDDGMAKGVMLTHATSSPTCCRSATLGRCARRRAARVPALFPIYGMTVLMKLRSRRAAERW